MSLTLPLHLQLQKVSPFCGIDVIPTIMFQPNTGVRAQAGQIGCQLGRQQHMKRFIDQAINSKMDKRMQA